MLFIYQFVYLTGHNEPKDSYMLALFPSPTFFQSSYYTSNSHSLEKLNKQNEQNNCFYKHDKEYSPGDSNSEPFATMMTKERTRFFRTTTSTTFSHINSFLFSHPPTIGTIFRIGSIVLPSTFWAKLPNESFLIRVDTA